MGTSIRGAELATTGVPGLDDVLHGGLPANRLYLIEGDPGAGKTTLGLQFLLEGVRRGESCLYISLSESKEEVAQVAASHGWSLEGLNLFELSSAEQTLHLGEENTLYATADVDLKETMAILLEEVERLKPARVVLDSIAEVRLLSQTPVRYRRQLLALKQHFADRNCTVLLLDDVSGPDGHVRIATLVHGVISLQQVSIDYGADRRRMRVAKLRGAQYRSGYHDFIIEPGGVRIFPRLIAAEYRSDFVPTPLSSGEPKLDALLGGGLDRSTAALFVGPSGTGKSALAVHFAAASAHRGENAALFIFEERIGTLLARARALGCPIDDLIKSGRIIVHQSDPAELAPDQFTSLVQEAVEEHDARLVVIDSLNGYFNAMPAARYLTLQMHELLSYLGEKGVASIMTVAQSGAFGGRLNSPLDVSYLSDTIVLLRYFESRGRVRKAISVLKKRSGRHEDSIREFSFSSNGIVMSEPMVDFHSILSGAPKWDGGSEGDLIVEDL